MAKIKAKAKNIKKSYNPQVELEQESSDLSEAIKHYKSIASCSGGGNTSMRQNSAYRDNMVDKYGALQDNFLTPKMAIRLAQIVYYRFGLVRHALDTMAEFTVSGIDFLSNKKASREAMLGWAAGVGLKSFLDQVALEYYRSGNVYIYRFETSVKDSAVRDLNKLFGSKISSSVKIPTRYTIIDPNLINFVTCGLLDSRLYQIVIPASEVNLTIQHYKNNPDALQGLPEEFRHGIESYMTGKKGSSCDLIISLNPENLICLYRKKQPYETYAVPFLAGTFEDLEFRQELRNMDKALSRVVARMLIHVAVGDEKNIPSPAALSAINDKLSNPSTSTYLITDGSVKINQYFPDVAKLLDPTKYQAVQSDIMTALGISPAAYGDAGGSFSNNFLGIKILIERIIDGRNKILQDFLIPETKRVANLFSIKSTITPEIIGTDLHDEKEWAKIYTRLYEDGVLSPQSTIESIRDDRFPTYEEEVERQKEAKELHDQGYFAAIVNRGGTSQSSGRPEGTANPTQTTPKNTTPSGQKASLVRSFTEEEFKKAKSFVGSELKHKLKSKKLSVEQVRVVESICKEFLLSQEFNEEYLRAYLSQLV